jgi:hypothetical protein
MPSDILIDPAFEGPPGSANGGYVCGLVSRHLGGDVEVTLRRPVPLGTPLLVEASADGVRLCDREAVVAEARRTTLTPRPLDQPPTLEEATAASLRFPGLAEHPFPRCVVCGSQRSDRAALGVFPGPVAGRPLLAAVWRPSPAALDGGAVRPEFAYATMDCPAGWAAAWFGEPADPIVLGRMAARLDGPLPARDAFVVAAWLEGVDGRKLHAGSALYSPEGSPVAFSRQTWVSLAPVRT